MKREKVSHWTLLCNHSLCLQLQNPGASLSHSRFSFLTKKRSLLINSKKSLVWDHVSRGLSAEFWRDIAITQPNGSTYRDGSIIKKMHFKKTTLRIDVCNKCYYISPHAEAHGILRKDTGLAGLDNFKFWHGLYAPFCSCLQGVVWYGTIFKIKFW
jgi:hypothetical protein